MPACHLFFTRSRLTVVTDFLNQKAPIEGVQYLAGNLTPTPP
jgi:hypothetical protein